MSALPAWPGWLDAAATAAALPYPALADAIEALLHDDTVTVPPRLVQPLPGGSSLFVMPAADARLAITKLITFVPDNPVHGRPAIQGDIVVFDARTGQRCALLDGPTVTARRTAAVSLLAARRLAPCPHGPLLIVGAGVQGRAHLEAFAAGLGVRQVSIASRSRSSAEALVQHARRLNLQAQQVDDPDAALADCPLVVSCTPAQAVVLRARPRPDAFVAAVGAFTPRMVEWAPEVCRHLAATGTVVVDTRDADHEAGDLLQAGLDVAALPALADVVRNTPAWQRARRADGPVFFKSCGWAGWDLAAARCGLATQAA
ncbi:MAG: delta(1)-pyrroline-2-carboxylate reductase family protein [Tepidimonas sp.]|uniref:delta(1)-pyrroline-2-carboxylate reductase family protein n=1 Tax=Tepidimonas sp. TaxID=2002775 RepID=UPI00298F0730|nr:delta(1)-pyrroline-2-carboxylate reductase family protein [Tepidimonas sp.]MDW8336688.1 delta(1)-pyrroline-2-carboxylate reductase family protein [Tepidimonas sp.]